MGEAVLVIEDSSTVSRVLKHLISQHPELDATFVTTRAEVQQALAQRRFFAALADLNLPDAPHGETVQDLLDAGVATVVLTGQYDESLREDFIHRGAVDYVVKDSRYAYGSAVQQLLRLHRNQGIKVLIAEDSRMTRHLIEQQLQRLRFEVFTAEDGVQALALLEANPDISLLITDYQMPNMDGFTLVRTIRQRFPKTDLVIIGLSAEGEGLLSARFIKNGANDFLRKPFLYEEFHCRVQQSIDSLELIRALRDSAERDFLTSLYNRRFFFEHAPLQLHPYQSCVALIDLDHFKRINDEYGHQAGDEVLKGFAKLLREEFPDQLCARLGGEEFSLLLTGNNLEQAEARLNDFRELVTEQLQFEFAQELVSVSCSIGIGQVQPDDSLEALLARADQCLYRAKDAGRNLVIAE